MITYLIIGIIVQAVIIIERAIRVPGYFELIDWKDWRLYVGLLYGITVNVALWPIAVFSEILLVVHGL